MHISEEKILIEEIKKDSSKFSIVFDKYYAVIFGYVVRRVADYDIAKDIASETFLKAFLNIGRFKWKGLSLSSWIYRIATNECLLYFRRSKYKPDSLDKLVSSGNFNIPDPATMPKEKSAIEKELQQHEDFIAIQKKIVQLPVPFQDVISLRYFEQKSIREIADILDKKEGTVKSLLSRGIKKLGSMLE